MQQGRRGHKEKKHRHGHPENHRTVKRPHQGNGTCDNLEYYRVHLFWVVHVLVLLEMVDQNGFVVSQRRTSSLALHMLETGGYGQQRD